MNYKVQINLVNNLKNIAKYGANLLEEEKLKSSRRFGYGEYGVRFIGSDDIETFNETIVKLMQIHELGKSITLKRFTARLVDFIEILLEDSTDCNEEDITSFYQQFLEQEYREFEIVGPIYGITIEENEYILGDFTIYKLSYLKELLSNKPGYYKELEKMYYGNIDSEYVIGLRVKAREQEKAVELANKHLEVFENVLNYIVSDTTHLRCPGIFNYKGHRVRSSLAITETGIGSNNEAISVSIPYKIRDKVCKSPNNGNVLIWDLITKKNKTVLEKRLLNAIDWVGKAIYEVDPAKALVE
jgi:hypothetical protein